MPSLKNFLLSDQLDKKIPMSWQRPSSPPWNPSHLSESLGKTILHYYSILTFNWYASNFCKPDMVYIWDRAHGLPNFHVRSMPGLRWRDPRIPDFHGINMQQKFATYKWLISLKLETGGTKDLFCNATILVDSGSQLPGEVYESRKRRFQSAPLIYWAEHSSLSVRYRPEAVIRP